MYSRLFLTIFLPLIVILNIANREALFRHPSYEEGDDAANALQIYKAKSLQELHGNYSRFNFNHPGPAFFYAYALGEILLYDHLKVVPTPRNAHLWVTVFLQCAFFSAALALLATKARQPYLFAALGATLGALHLGHVWGAFFSNWPPHVLLMPFLCLLVSGAVVSLGRGEGLFTLVLSGCLLVHGHVAQPLFVFPVVGVAVAAMIRHRRAAGDRWIMRADTATPVVAALFVLPLVLDLFLGEVSNAQRILLHFAHQVDRGQSFYQSFLCFASYYVYCGDQAKFNVLQPASYADFIGRWPVLVLWLSVTSAAILFAWRGRKSGETGRLAWRLIGFFALGVALTLVWGMRQDGGFTPFNGFLNNGLILLPVLAAILLVGARSVAEIQRDTSLADGRKNAAEKEGDLAARPPRRTWGIAVTSLATVGAGVAFTVCLRMPMEDGRGRTVHDNLPALLAADPVPNSAKLLEFGFVDGDWYETTTLARALQRAQIACYVQPGWRVMFGEDKVFENQGHLLERDAVSRWQVVLRATHPDALPLTSEHGVRFPAVKTLGALPATISFASNGSHDDFRVYGICPRDPESDWVWTEAKVAVLDFVAAKQDNDVLLTLDAGAIVTSARRGGQRVGVIVNGEKLAQWHLTARAQHSVRIPAALWNRRRAVRVILEIPDAVVPASVFGSGERRQLGLSLHNLAFVPVPETNAIVTSRE